MSLYFKIVNPIVQGLLASPLHGLMSHNTTVLVMTGRKSGKRITTPISYWIDDTGSVNCFTALQGKWWRNLEGGRQAKLLLKGKWQTATAVIERGDTHDIRRALAEFLIAVPRDAPHSGVKLLESGEPDQSDIEREAKTHVLIRFQLDN